MSESYFSSHVFVCLNQRVAGDPRGCCKEKGSEALRDYMKRRVKQLGLPDARVNIAGCLDRCEHGPVMVIYPEGIWYSPKTEQDIEDIIQTHLVKGELVGRLQI